MKQWMNFKELQELKHDDECPSFTPSDLGANREGHAPGWKDVSVHDPEIQNAARNRLAINLVMEETSKFNLGLKVKRGNKEEHFNLELHKNEEGNYKLN